MALNRFLRCKGGASLEQVTFMEVLGLQTSRLKSSPEIAEQRPQPQNWTAFRPPVAKFL